MTKRASASEEEYFAREERERRSARALETQQQVEQTEREALKALHYMHCPKCGTDLETLTLQGVQIDRCSSCKGTWLDEGELEQLSAKEPGFLKSVLGVFGGKGKD